MDGWRRAHVSRRRPGCRGCMPSPNIPTLDSAIVYPGTVLFEGTNVSEGRGTTRPFELLGAPWVDAESASPRAERARLPGVHFRPAVFEPTFHKHAKIACGGCQIHVTDRERVPSCRPCGAALDRGVPRGRPGSLRAGAIRRTNTRRTSPDRHPLRIGRASRTRCQRFSARARAVLGEPGRHVQRSATAIPSLLKSA